MINVLQAVHSIWKLLWWYHSHWYSVDTVFCCSFDTTMTILISMRPLEVTVLCDDWALFWSDADVVEMAVYSLQYYFFYYSVLCIYEETSHYILTVFVVLRYDDMVRILFLMAVCVTLYYSFIEVLMYLHHSDGNLVFIHCYDWRSFNIVCFGYIHFISAFNVIAFIIPSILIQSDDDGSTFIDSLEIRWWLMMMFDIQAGVVILFTFWCRWYHWPAESFSQPGKRLTLANGWLACSVRGGWRLMQALLA